MNVTFSVYRYNPDVDNVPHMKEYRLDIPEGSDMMVLDALIQLKELIPRSPSAAPAAKGSVDQTVST